MRWPTRAGGWPTTAWRCTRPRPTCTACWAWPPDAPLTLVGAPYRADPAPAQVSQALAGAAAATARPARPAGRLCRAGGQPARRDPRAVPRHHDRRQHRARYQRRLHQRLQPRHQPAAVRPQPRQHRHRHGHPRTAARRLRRARAGHPHRHPAPAGRHGHARPAAAHRVGACRCSWIGPGATRAPAGAVACSTGRPTWPSAPMRWPPTWTCSTCASSARPPRSRWKSLLGDTALARTPSSAKTDMP